MNLGLSWSPINLIQIKILNDTQTDVCTIQQCVTCVHRTPWTGSRSVKAAVFPCSAVWRILGGRVPVVLTLSQLYRFESTCRDYQCPPGFKTNKEFNLKYKKRNNARKWRSIVTDDQQHHVLLDIIIYLLMWPKLYKLTQAQCRVVQIVAPLFFRPWSQVCTLLDPTHCYKWFSISTHTQKKKKQN